MNEKPDLSGVICSLMSFRCCWENNSGRKRLDLKVPGKKGEANNLVSCPRNFLIAVFLICFFTGVFVGCTSPKSKVPTDSLGQRILLATEPLAPPDQKPPELTEVSGSPDTTQTKDAQEGVTAQKPTKAPGSPGVGKKKRSYDPAGRVASPVPPGVQLTLQQVIDYAYRYNPRLRLLRERVNQAREGKQMAFSAFLPEASISSRGLRGTDRFSIPTIPSYVGNVAFGGSADSFLSAELNLQWVVWDFGRTTGRYEQMKAGEEIAALQYQRGRQTVAFNVTAAYFRVLQQRAKRKVAEEAVRRADSFLYDARNFLRQGTAVRNDVLQAELLLAEMQLEFVSSQTAEGIAVASLNRAMGLHVSSSTKIVDQNQEPTFSFVLAECLQLAVDNREEFRSVLNAIASSQWGLAVSQAKFLPRILSGVTGVLRGGNDLEENSLLVGGVSIELDLFKGTRRFAELRSSRAEVRARIAQAEEVADTIAFEVIAAYLNINDAQQRIVLSRTAVASGEENLKVLLELFGGGDATSTDVVDAELALVRAQQSYYTALYSYQTALAQLDYAVGTPVIEP